MSIFRIALILFCFIRFSDSLFCYVCSGCNDPFQVGTNIGVFFADNSGYYCRKTSSSKVVTRDASTSCTHSGTSGNGQWCCQTDVCNHSKNILPKTILILFLSFLVSV